MSILLEALKKSEKNQNLHKAPTIHTEDQSGPVTESLHTGYMVVLLVIALFASGWFVWHQYQAPAENYQSPVTLATSKGDTLSVPENVHNQVDKGTASAPVVVDTAGQKRTPVESYQPADKQESLQETTKDSATVNSVVGLPATPPRRPEQKSNAETEEAKSAAAVANQPVKAEAEPYHPGEPAPIGYWDLPDSVRSQVPEIKFSVLVYAKDPADRFVLINGQRMEEGDSPQSGLVVEEIRREGVIFSYRLYRFLVER